MTLTDDDKFWLLREADWQREQAAHDAARLAEELRTMDPVQFLREYGIKNACPRHLSADGRSYLCLSESEHFATVEKSESSRITTALKWSRDRPGVVGDVVHNRIG